uniref:Helix-turn-helix domain protein n=1 Tax=Pithovirus LCPAC401 TaxID=2506595 RepID=A0A481ZC81_9VIRU|nr:MAG: helix-turn-helix domain protein [Pithovirus LCPAC401]
MSNSAIDDLVRGYKELMLDENKENIHRLILNYLEEEEAIDEDSAKSPQSIARYIFGKKATKKIVNPYLYSMLANGAINKVTEEDMKRPRWYLVD